MKFIVYIETTKEYDASTVVSAFKTCVNDGIATLESKPELGLDIEIMQDIQENGIIMEQE